MAAAARRACEVRYFEQDNLFRETPVESNMIEIGGTMPIMQTRRNDLGIALRVTQESVETTTDALRTADLSANGTLILVPSLVLHYGMASRIGLDGQELAPRTGAEWKLTENSSIIGSVLVQSARPRSRAIHPAEPRVLVRERARAAAVRIHGRLRLRQGREEPLLRHRHVTAVDDPLRVVFADERTSSGMASTSRTGDVRRDVRVAYRREFGNRFAVDVATTAGTATPQRSAENEREKVYVTGDLQSTFIPTRTSLAVSYREIQQPGQNGDEDYRPSASTCAWRSRSISRSTSSCSSASSSPAPKTRRTSWIRSPPRAVEEVHRRPGVELLGPPKSRSRRGREQTLPDVIAPNLDVLFCGINPGLYTAAVSNTSAVPAIASGPPSIAPASRRASSPPRNSASC
jgi:hypothetical protein